MFLVARLDDIAFFKGNKSWNQAIYLTVQTQLELFVTILTQHPSNVLQRRGEVMNFQRKVVLFSQSLFVVMITLSSVVSRAAFSDSGIQPAVDVAQFFDTERNSYIEIYYAIPEASICYVPNDQGKFSCQLVMDVEIYFDGELWANKAWRVEKAVEDTNLVQAGSHMVDLLRYFIDEPGDYTIKMHVKDMHLPSFVDSVEAVFSVQGFKEGNITVSDLQLASSISKASGSTPSALIKNNYKIIPSPNGIYGEGSPNLYYYFEAYNLLSQIPGDRYKTVCKVIDSNDNEIEGLGITYRSKKKLNDTSIEIGMMNVGALPSGKYRFVYGIANDDKTLLASKEKLFYVYNPNVAPIEPESPVVDLNGGFGPLAPLTEEELDDEFAKLIYVDTKEDRKFYKNLKAADGKREFILSIWSRGNNDNLNTMAYREQYLGRARYSEQQFKSVFGKGWKSDRGRVFILYGIPSDVERFPSTESTVPYQIWHYDKLRGQGDVQFVFGDAEGFSKYRLLHSTLRGEVSDPQWKGLIFRGSNERQFR